MKTGKTPWEQDATETGGGSPGPRPPKVDYKEVLKPEEFEVFSRLRDWRKITAEKEGVPVYAVLTNGQLAQLAQKKITTKAGLKEIEGVGDARVDKSGLTPQSVSRHPFSSGIRPHPWCNSGEHLWFPARSSISVRGLSSLPPR